MWLNPYTVDILELKLQKSKVTGSYYGQYWLFPIVPTFSTELLCYTGRYLDCFNYGIIPILAVLILQKITEIIVCFPGEISRFQF